MYGKDPSHTFRSEYGNDLVEGLASQNSIFTVDLQYSIQGPVLYYYNIYYDELGTLHCWILKEISTSWPPIKASILSILRY